MVRGMSRDRARRLRRDETEAERTLWARLRERRLIDAKFRRQHPVGPFVTDFCCSERGLVVELDAGQHAVRLETDGRRTEFLAARGFRVLRFWDNEVFKNIEGVLHVIAQALMNSHPDPLPSPHLTPPHPTLSPEGGEDKGEGGAGKETA